MIGWTIFFFIENRFKNDACQKHHPRSYETTPLPTNSHPHPVAATRAIIIYS